MENELYVVLYADVSNMLKRSFHAFHRFIIISNLAYYSRLYSSPDFDLIHDLRDSLTKVPLALQDTQAATSVICTLASVLLYSTHETRLAWRQGLMLCTVLSEVQLAHNLTGEEMRVIYSLAMRRLEWSVDHVFVFLMPDLNHLQVIHRHPGYFADHGK